MIELSKLTRIDIETINNCNAKCPLCLREPGMRTNDQLDWFTVSKNIPAEVWGTVKDINFNGTTGDNIMHPQIYDILCDVVSKTSGRITVNTNGSLRSTDWWSQLGTLFKDTDHRVIFGIDGLEDTHSIYRVNTSYNKIIENAQAFIGAGGKAEWQFILFDHNGHQVEQCRDLAMQLGFSRFFMFYQDRFDSTEETKTIKLYKKDLSPFKDYLVVKETSQDIKQKLSAKFSKIQCHSQSVNWFSIYADGTVWPCCWLMGWHRAQHQKLYPVVNYHFKNILKIDFADISLYNRTLEQVISSELWQKRFADSFTNMPNPVCVQQCSK